MRSLLFNEDAMSTLIIDPACAALRFELRFEPLTHTRPALAFPCDARGVVDLDVMGPRARNSYLAARALLGHDYLYPVVCRV